MSKSGKPTVENKLSNNSAAESAKCAQGTSGTNDRTAGSSKSTKRSPKHMQLTHSDGTLIKGRERAGLKEKLVNKVTLWNSKEKRVTRSKITKESSNFVADFEGLTLSPDASDDNLFQSDWLKAKDSLENLLSTRCEKSEIPNSKSTHFKSSKKPMLSESPCSESQIGSSNAMNSVSRVLAWDPWDKLGRKNKKESKQRRKREKTPSDNNISPNSKDHTSGDELRNGETSSQLTQDNAVIQEGDEYLQTYEYQPYRKKTKTVEFINEVMVVYITGNEVVGESTEPLKKELDQQIRNKEMRKGHYPTTLFGRRKLDDDYMSAWLKK